MNPECHSLHRPSRCGDPGRLRSRPSPAALGLWLVVAATVAGCDDRTPPPPDDSWGATATALANERQPQDAVTPAEIAALPVVDQDAGAVRAIAALPSSQAVSRLYHSKPIRGPRFGGAATSHDWGVAIVGDEVRHTFVLRNSGSQPLRILRASATPGCATLVFDRDIAPGEQGRFEIALQTAKMSVGNSRLTVALETSDRRWDATLVLQGRLELPPADGGVAVQAASTVLPTRLGRSAARR